MLVFRGHLLILNILLLGLVRGYSHESDLRIFVHMQNITGEIENFWDSSGFSCPKESSNIPKFLLSRDVKLNLAIISSVPYNGLRYIRIHWLLNLLKMKSPLNDCCDFSDLDNLLDWIISLRLKLGFEIMGNPGGIFSNSKMESETFSKWGDIVYKTIQRYTNRYGAEEISEWRFETWNEPDLKQYNILNFTLPEYLFYVNATINALRSATTGPFRLKLGGPAGLFKNTTKHPLCWGFLEHCNKKENPCGLDFISFHRKGNGSSLNVVKETLFLLSEVSNTFPNLNDLPYVNDESDILSGWWRSEQWRGDARYAAAISRVIQLFQSSKKIHKLQWISNDNAFLNFHPHYFSQRTLLARFHINNTKHQHTQFFHKPVFSVMTLLALINGKELYVQMEDTNRISVLASKDGDCNQCFCNANILIVSSSDTMKINRTKSKLEVDVILPKWCNIPVKYSLYMLSNTLPHPQKLWKKYGKPKFPSFTVRQQMRKSEGPHRIHFEELFPSGNTLKIKLNVTQPSVSLLHFCSMQKNIPGQVDNLNAINITFNEVLLLWSDRLVLSRCIKTYIIEFCQFPCERYNFRRINREDIISLSFQHVLHEKKVLDESVRGVYKVHAVDYWERAGPSSDSIMY